MEAQPSQRHISFILPAALLKGFPPPLEDEFIAEYFETHRNTDVKYCVASCAACFAISMVALSTEGRKLSGPLEWAVWSVVMLLMPSALLVGTFVLIRGRLAGFDTKEHRYLYLRTALQLGWRYHGLLAGEVFAHQFMSSTSVEEGLIVTYTSHSLWWWPMVNTCTVPFRMRWLMDVACVLYGLLAPRRCWRFSVYRERYISLGREIGFTLSTLLGLPGVVLPQEKTSCWVSSVFLLVGVGPLPLLFLTISEAKQRASFLERQEPQPQQSRSYVSTQADVVLLPSYAALLFVPYMCLLWVVFVNVPTGL